MRTAYKCTKCDEVTTEYPTEVHETEVVEYWGSLPVMEVTYLVSDCCGVDVEEVMYQGECEDE